MKTKLQHFLIKRREHKNLQNNDFFFYEMNGI